MHEQSSNSSCTDLSKCFKEFRKRKKIKQAEVNKHHFSQITDNSGHVPFNSHKITLLTNYRRGRNIRKEPHQKKTGKDTKALKETKIHDRGRKDRR